VTDRKPLLPNDWGDLSPLVDQLLDAPLSERPALLDALAAGNPTRRAELERLVSECERDLPLLERPAAERFSQLRHDDGPALPEQLGGRYRIEREIGRGGMAVVYLAHDMRHSRRVAVKVIRPEIASSLARERFLREIGIAARLRHPNIMPLYDSGDADEMLYFVMPFEEGKSLRARLESERRLGVAEGVSILRDVARALAYAHQQNVVHRDIKPDNVLLAGDAAVVTDFGIAKAITAAATEAGVGTITNGGAAIGTPAYMSPEQAVGDPATDHRADIYAFGCMAYEVFAGAPPFVGTTAHQIISAQLSERPKPLAGHRSDIPDAVERLIQRCLEKNPNDRPASAADLLDVLGATTATKERALGKFRPSRRVVASLLALPLLILAVWFAVPFIRGGPVSIAVLPLEIAGDSAQPLAVGFSDDLASALVGKRWLLVKSRTGARTYLGQGDIDARSVGKTLGVRYLVMGSMRGEGSDRSLTLHLVECETGGTVWADKFIGATDLEALRDDLAKTIGEKLRGPAGRFASAFVDSTRKQRGNDQAYKLYLFGKKLLVERTRANPMQLAAEQFNHAIAIDSNSAYAWSGLSLALALSAAFEGRSIDSVGPQARVSAARALTLDPTLSEPHSALGIVHGLYWEWDKAEEETKTALKLSPHDIEARIQYIRVLNAQDRLKEARAQVEKALEDDPASSTVLAFKSLDDLLHGELDSAMAYSDRALQSDTLNLLVRFFRVQLLVKKKRAAEARTLILESPIPEPYMMYGLAASGDTAEVRRRVAKLPPSDTRRESDRAYAFLAVGDTAAAFAAFDRATDRHEIWPILSARALPAFDKVRDTPRFRALLKRVGLASR
jgi:eukaryotic-like serine/threonine-protein kinase